MSTEASSSALVRQANQLPMTTMGDFNQASELLAKAGFLGCKNAGEAFMVVSACHQRNEDLVSFQQKFHLRQGRFSMTAHAMLDEFVRRGGSFSRVVRTSDRASITLKKDGNTYTSGLTWEDAREEPFVYAGNETDQIAILALPADKREAKLKPKYKTPRGRMQMLWSRVISDGVSTLDPGARLAYTSDEVADITGTDPEMDEIPEEIIVDPDEVEIIPPTVEPANELAADKTAQSTVDFPENPSEATINYKVMPFGEKAGTPWTDMPNKYLEGGLKVKDPRLTDSHKAEIELVLAARKEASK